MLELQIMTTDTHQDLDDAASILGGSKLCSGLGLDELAAVADAARTVRFHSGEVVCRHNEPGDSMFIVAQGRLKLSLDQDGSQLRLLEYLGRGEHFGEMALLTDGRHAATATAVMDSTLLEIDQESFHRLMVAVPGFAANLSRSLGFRLHGQANGKRSRRRPKVVALVHSTVRSEGLVPLLATALAARGRSVQVLTDRDESFPDTRDYLVERIPETSDSQRPTLLQGRIAQMVEHRDRVLLDVLAARFEASLPGLLLQCEEVWWLAESRHPEMARRSLEMLLTSEPRLAERIRVIWILDGDESFSPPPWTDLNIDPLDFKVPLSPAGTNPSRNQRHGIARLVRHLQGTRIGVALGGGGARGLSHLGVLRALERADISFDLLSGTSCGALMGLSYAGGWDPQKALLEFNQALTPHWLLRKIPGGNHWYLWAMFRSGAWDRMLRPYLGDVTLEQLQVPMYTVATDLVTGQPVIRERGDAINAVLESINFPPIARPILRDGMALIDGGVLNNLPADILPARGADLVVGVDVTAKLRQRFAKNTPGMPTAEMRRPGLVETLWRVTEVQDYGVSTLRRAGLVDLTIAPDVSTFDFVDFSQGMPLAEMGEAAAEEVIPQLKQMLADLEDKAE